MMQPFFCLCISVYTEITVIKNQGVTMMTSALTYSSQASALVQDKKLWMRVNRVLAWALVGSPLLQIMLGTNLVRGLWLDLAILIAHGALSVALFGLPKNKDPRQALWTRWAGLPEHSMSPRNKFLLSGWRVAVSSLWLVAMPTAMIVWGWIETAVPALKVLNSGLGMALLPVFYIGGYFGLLLQYGIVTHLHRATVYALRRWGCAPADAPVVAYWTVAVFLAASIANLFRPLWS
jgi:hypothetical protein